MLKTGLPKETNKTKNFMSLRKYFMKTDKARVSPAVATAKELSVPRKKTRYNVHDTSQLLGTETKDIGRRLVPYGNTRKQELDIEIYGRPTQMTKQKLFKPLQEPQHILRDREFTFL